MVFFPNAKINLGLHVVSKRNDGYHDIQTVFYPIKKLCDILEVQQSDSLTFTVTGIAIDGEPENNLCVKAYRNLERKYSLPPANIHLHKLIPMGAGLGGGSADASFVLHALNKVFELNLNSAQLKEVAAELGSDCAFFVDNTPSYGTGRGEILCPIELDLSAWHLVLVKPNIHVSTSAAYAGIKAGIPKHDIRDVIKLHPSLWKDKLVNDFEPSVFGQFPSIAEIKEKLYASGATYSSMSGSGATVFGLFDRAVDLSSQFNGCFVHTVQLS